MKHWRAICLGLILLSGSGSIASASTLIGSAQNYLPGSYEIRTVNNPVTLKSAVIGELVISGDSGFRAEFSVDRPSWISMDIGVYRMILLVDPGISYRIELPPASEKTKKQLLSPYFEPVIVHLKVLERYRDDGKALPLEYPDLNDRLYSFDTLFFSMSERIMTERHNGQPTDTECVISELESGFTGDSSVYFRSYRYYRYGLLELSAAKTGLGEVRERFLPDAVPGYLDPAYMELFNKMFDEFLVYYGRTSEGRPLVPAVNRYRDLSSLRSILRQHPAIKNDTIADMVILSDLYTQFFKETFYRESIIAILDSIAASPALPEYGVFATEIREKLTRLLPGNDPPAFSLRGMNGKLYSPGDFKGKYVYLVFCTPDNYSCMMEYPYLKSYQEKHSSYLAVVNIMVCDTYEQMSDFMLKNGYTWQSLYYGDEPAVMLDYDVRIFPACYLLGPDGKLILSPAKLPSEGFEQSLFKIMRSRGDI